MLRFPDQAFTVIILSNLAEFPDTQLAEAVADLYLGDLYTAGPEAAGTESRDPRTVPTRKSPDIVGSESGEYSGRYYSTELEVTYVVHLVDDALRYQIGHSPAEFQLVPTGRDEWDADQAEFRFLRNSSMTVTGLSLSSGRIRDIQFEKIHR
jgi:hypothetical protein